MDTTIAKIGDNRPPDAAAILAEQLNETHAPLIERANELLGVPLPTEMNDDEEARISETIKMCTKFIRNADVTRLAANEPHRALISATDGFFKNLSDKVEKLKAKLNAQYLTPYQQDRADKEKRRREAAAAEAKRIADEAAEAERVEQRRLAEIKKAEDDARAEAARIAREKIEAEEREERNRKLRETQAALAKTAGERAAQAAAQREADEKAAADKKKRDDEAAAAKRLQDKLEVDRLQQEEAERKARDDAKNAQEADDKARVAASAKAADMSRSRSTLGAVASLRTTWEFQVTNPALVPRQFLSVNETAIRVAVKAATTPDGKNDLKIDGVRIYPKTDSVVR